MKWLAGAVAIVILLAAGGAAVISSGLLKLDLAELETRYATEDSRFMDVDVVKAPALGTL